MLDLQPHKQEIDTPDNDILQVVFRLGVLKLDVQTILDTDVHLNRAVVLWRHAVGIDPKILLAHDVGHTAGDGDAHEIPELYVDAIVRFVLLLDVLEIEGEGLGVLEFSGSCEFLDEGEEFVVVSAVVKHLFRHPSAIISYQSIVLMWTSRTNRSDELHLNSRML